MLSVLCLDQLVTWTSVTQTHSATIIHILHTKVHTHELVVHKPFRAHRVFKTCQLQYKRGNANDDYDRLL